MRKNNIAIHLLAHKKLVFTWQMGRVAKMGYVLDENYLKSVLTGNRWSHHLSH